MLDSKGSGGARPDRDDPRPHQRRQELVVFADRQQRDIEPCRPRFTLGMTGADRLGDDQHAGHRPLEFEKAALHVVPTRHQTQAAIALLPHPACGLARVAERVVGIVAEDDTARITIGMPGDAQQFDPVDMRVDAGNEQLLRPSGAEQVEPRLKPQPTAGQHDDRIGFDRRVSGDRQRTVHEPDEPGAPYQRGRRRAGGEPAEGARPAMPRGAWPGTRGGAHGIRANWRSTVIRAVTIATPPAASPAMISSSHTRQSKIPYVAIGTGSSSICPAGPRITTVSAAAAPPMTPPRRPNPSACTWNCRAM